MKLIPYIYIVVTKVIIRSTFFNCSLISCTIICLHLKKHIKLRKNGILKDMTSVKTCAHQKLDSWIFLFRDECNILIKRDNIFIYMNTTYLYWIDIIFTCFIQLRKFWKYVRLIIYILSRYGLRMLQFHDIFSNTYLVW